MTIRLKGCPRCNGDLALERDLGNYQCWTCIQCGHETEEHGNPPPCRPPVMNYQPDNTGRHITKKAIVK